MRDGRNQDSTDTNLRRSKSEVQTGCCPQMGSRADVEKGCYKVLGVLMGGRKNWVTDAGLWAYTNSNCTIHSKQYVAILRLQKRTTQACHPSPHHHSHPDSPQGAEYSLCHLHGVICPASLSPRWFRWGSLCERSQSDSHAVCASKHHRTPGSRHLNQVSPIKIRDNL